MIKSKIATTYAIAAVVLGLALSSSSITGALAANIHFVGTPTCTASPTAPAPSRTLTCTGKVGGLGNISQVRVFLSADVTTFCTTKSGSNSPPGQTHVTSPTQNLQVSNGQITFTETITATANCHGTQTGTVGSFTNIALNVGGTSLLITNGPV